MKLSDFIASAILDIKKGVLEAQTKANVQVKVIRRLEFDIAVSGQSEASTAGKLGLDVLGVGASAEGKMSSSEVNRVKFSIDIYPKSAEKKSTKKNQKL